MTKHTLSTAEYILHYVIIAMSAVFIALPVARAVPFAKVVVSLMVFALLGYWIWRDRKRGLHDLTLPEILSRAQKGQRFAPSIFELVTTIAAFIAFWLTI